MGQSLVRSVVSSTILGLLGCRSTPGQRAEPSKDSSASTQPVAVLDAQAKAGATGTHGLPSDLEGLVIDARTKDGTGKKQRRLEAGEISQVVDSDGVVQVTFDNTRLLA